MEKNKFFDLCLALPQNGQIWFQQPASPVMEGIIDLQLEMSFHFIYILTLVVYGLIGSVAFFQEATTYYSSRVSHWTLLERIYSIIPMISIICIYAPSFSLLYAMDEYPDTFVCVKVIGRQWYWHYEVTYDGYKHFVNIDSFLKSKVLSKEFISNANKFTLIKNTNIFYSNNYTNYYNKMILGRNLPDLILPKYITSDIFAKSAQSFFHLFNQTSVKSINYQQYLTLRSIWLQYISSPTYNTKLLALLHKNIISLPKITNFSFDSYCLSDYTLKSKYIAPKLISTWLRHEDPNQYYYNWFQANKFDMLLKQYVTLNGENVFNNIKNFYTFRTSRLLETSKALLLPTGTPIRALITSSDVIHSWAIPSLGIKTDGIPGRLNQVFFIINKDGIYYGQCSELCGQYHFAMPIVIKSLSWYSCINKDCYWCNLAKYK